MRPWLARLIAAAIAGVAYPYAELAWKCRDGFTNSEACVWARSYFSLSRWVEPVIVTPIVFGLLTAATFIIKRRRGPGERV